LTPAPELRRLRLTISDFATWFASSTGPRGRRGALLLAPANGTRERQSGVPLRVGGGDEAHLQAAGLVDLVVVDLGERQLLLQPQRVVAAPANELGEMPRKSRDRGKVMLVNRSRNSYIRGPRSVTIAPIGIPSRSLEGGDRLLRPGHHRLLTGDGLDVADGGVDGRRVLTASPGRC
jgi:hypothetical protein